MGGYHLNTGTPNFSRLVAHAKEAVDCRFSAPLAKQGNNLSEVAFGAPDVERGDDIKDFPVNCHCALCVDRQTRLRTYNQ